ncbi:hypothetical protein DNL40_02600 [Xylanimonas oleitrophica]|uniref:DUF4326 domain-containing protein n=1 Tax=Xylanimonas oleitrophica TaxID=2607479 RepID=A0A2W5WUY0_9MICO|nr:DUF4326 domain-containing protein [Xylanimonas oleitrophica]PZR55279.1 hypothetical protein DNL40_02600 [Xylanimonas oleitrophica]
MPERIQLRRTKGWRKPEGAIVVTRGTKWGNPFVITHVVPTEWWVMDVKYADATSAHEASVDRYREYLPTVPDLDVTELAGHDLACWCPLDQPCHADVLLELANGGAS